MKKVTLYDVARISEVSPKTVSRVINGESSVSTKTRELVESKIAELRYTPNPSARSLRTKKSYVLALLYDNLSPSYVMDLQSGIQSVCEKSGFNMLIRSCNSYSPTLVEEISTLFEHPSVDGLLLSPPLSDHKILLQYLDDKGIHYIRIAPIDQQNRSPFVYANDKEAATELTDYLISLGHREIAIILGHPSHSAAIERLKGYKESLEKSGIKTREHLIKQGNFSFESGEEMAQQLLEAKDRPTAIFACNDDMAAGVMKVAHKLGIKVPEKLSICGFDDAPVSKQVWPTLTTIRQPVSLIASNSTDLLIQKILNREVPAVRLGLECQLVIRESTAPAAQSTD